MQRIPQKLKANSRQLRKEMTDAEQLLWRHIRRRQLHGLKFRRQHPYGNFILDFACAEIRLALEIDGGQHNLQSLQDARRTESLTQQGWIILRFWNNEVLSNVNAVLEVIDEHCKKLLPPS